MGRGKEKLKKSKMSLLSRDIVEKVGDKILHEIMEEDHKNSLLSKRGQTMTSLLRHIHLKIDFQMAYHNE